MKKTILIVDDEPEFMDSVRLILETAGYEVITAGNGLEALQFLRNCSIALILADIAMPVMNGYQLFNRVHHQPEWAYIPFIFLSGRNLNSDIRYGKELGVDDYLTKPVRSGDLLAIVRGKLKRAARWQKIPESSPIGQTAADQGEKFELGALKISLNQHRVWLDGDQIQLSSREFKLLACLAEKPGRAVSHQALIQATHGLKTDAQDASSLLRPLVRSLRRKLGYVAGERGCIESVRGFGYQIIPPQ